jgi:hypothetical protein
MSTPLAPTLSLDQSREIVSLVIESLKNPKNEAELKSILTEADKSENPFMFKLSKLFPRIIEILGTEISTVLGPDVTVHQSNVMTFLMQIQTVAQSDLALSLEVAKVTKVLAGDFSGLYEVNEIESEEIE